MVGGWIISVYIFFLLLICRVFRFFLQSTCVIHIVGVKGRCVWGGWEPPFFTQSFCILIEGL